MFKKFLKKVLLLLLILLVSITLSNCAYSSKEKGGYFKKLHTTVPSGKVLIKFKDGRLFIRVRDEITSSNFIFNPTTDSFKKTTNFKSDINVTNAIQLADGKILFLGPYVMEDAPTDKLKLYSLIEDDLFEKRLKKCRIVESALTDSEIRNLRRQVYLEEYASLYEDEREKLLLPYLKKNPELMKKYNDCVAEYEQSMYGQIYDPVTETFEYTKGKLNIRRYGVYLVLLKNGNVLKKGGKTPRDNRVPIGISDEGMSERAAQMEIYDPKTQTFSLIPSFLKNPEKWYYVYNPYNFYTIYQLADGEIYNVLGEIYNPNTNLLKKIPELPNRARLKLPDDRIIFIGENSEDINAYNPKTNKISLIGKTIIPRGRSYVMTLLNNENILIYDGTNEKLSNPFMGYVRENRLEILNIKTGKSTLLKNRYSSSLYYPMLLNDGRIFFVTQDGYELYIPEK